MSPAQRYDAFVSYAHSQHEVVERMHHDLERFAKPWWRSRSTRLYRDRTTMPAEPSLQRAIFSAMALSSKLVVVLSPAAAASAWVNQEIAWWLGTEQPPHQGGAGSSVSLGKTAADLILVLVDGELGWRNGRWTAGSTALPDALCTLNEEPRWVTLKGVRPGSDDWVDRIAEVSAAIHNVPKDALHGVHVQESRRRLRHFGAAGALGVVLLVVGLVASLIAGQQTQLAWAGQLAARSTALLGVDLPQSALLAVAAHRTAPNAETTAALFRAVTAAPQTTGYLDAGQEVTAVARARLANVVVAGTASGDVLRWTDGVREVIGRTDGPTTSVAVSDDGAVASMTGGTRALLWTTEHLNAVDLGDDRMAGPTAMSPSGRTALFNAVATDDLSGSGQPPGSIVRIDVPTSVYFAIDLPGRWEQLYAPTDGEIAAGGVDGRWWRRSSDGSADISGSVYMGAHDGTPALSPNGLYFTTSNGDTAVPVWDAAAGEQDRDLPPRTATVPGSSRDALAISPAGDRLAASDAGSVYISEISTDPPDRPLLALAGTGTVTALTFISDDVLIGAAGSQVVTWDLTRSSRILLDTTVAPVPVPCNACSGVEVAVRPDGQAAAVIGGYSGVLVHFTDHDPVVIEFTAPLTDVYADVMWAPDGTLILPLESYMPTSDAEIRSSGDGNLIGKWPVERDAAIHVMGLSRADDGSVYDVGGSLGVLIRDPRSGEILTSRPEPTVAPGGPQQIEDDAVNPDEAQAAIVAGGTARLFDLATGDEYEVATGVAQVAFADDALVVRLKSDQVQIRAAADGELRHQTADLPLTERNVEPTTNGQLVADVTTDHTVRLIDADSSIIGTIPIDARVTSRQVGLAFTPDGTTLLIAEPGSAVQRINVVPADWEAMACTLAGRELTREEWAAAGGSGDPGGQCAP